jgi:NAD(P)-dependent dehydrogenase (short-subunit alcohol dehydrogenase family)
VLPRRQPRYDVAGRTVLITGAAQGIGLALARALYAQQAKVALVDCDVLAVRPQAAELGERAFAIDADVRDRPAMASAVEATVRRFGHLDVVVANAGVSPVPATLRSMDSADFDRVIDVNLIGAFNTVKPALEHVISAEGHIVLVASCAAFTPGAGGSAYMISKAAVEQLGRALRLELAGHGVSVQIAYFGIVETAMTHGILDADDMGRRVNAMLPWPLNRRISADRAAATIADGIAARAPATMAPAGWSAYSVLRGIANPLIDRVLVRDVRMRDLVREIEAR